MLFIWAIFLACKEKKEGIILLPVGVRGKFGYIDKKGNYVIKPQFDKAGSFSEGIAKEEFNK